MNPLPNISESDLEAIAARSNFRGEEFYVELDEAISAARKRSLLTNKVVYLAESPDNYVVHTHGVGLKWYDIISTYKKGEQL